MYSTLGLSFKLRLSTRPNSLIGEVSDWDEVEQRLRSALRDFSGEDWTIEHAKDFSCGPTVHVAATRMSGREPPCTSIRIDLRLPEKVPGPYYTAGTKSVVLDSSVSQARSQDSLPSGTARLIMIRFSTLGPVDRFSKYLVGHFDGNWPFWLSPRQIIVLPCSPDAQTYAIDMQASLRPANLLADVDVTARHFPRKFADALWAQYNIIVLVGSSQMEAGTISIRYRNEAIDTKRDMIGLDEAITRLEALRDERRLTHEI